MGIITQAAALRGFATLVIGRSGEGKSTLMRDEVLKAKAKKVLWVSFTNTGPLYRHKPSENFLVAKPKTWAEFESEVVIPVRQGELDPQIIVLDGLHYLSNQSLEHEAGGDFTSQADWADMGRAMQKAIVTLRDNCDELFAACDIIPDDEGAFVIAMNRDLKNKIMGLFDNKWYCYTAPEKDTKGKLTGSINYFVQHVAAMALRQKKN